MLYKSDQQFLPFNIPIQPLPWWLIWTFNHKNLPPTPKLQEPLINFEGRMIIV